MSADDPIQRKRSGFEPSPSDSSSRTEETRSHGKTIVQLENYLDHLYAPLVGVIPFPQRQELRLEAKDHLLSMIQTMMETGSSETDAVMEALNRFGKPRKLSRGYLKEWKRNLAQPAPWPMKLLIPIAIESYGVAILLTALLLLPPFAGRGDVFFNQGLLYSDIWGAFIPPVLVGIFTGWLTQGRTFIAHFYALSFYILAAAILYLCDLPLGSHPYGGFSSLTEFFAVCITLYWLPLGFVGIGMGRRLRHLYSWTRHWWPAYRRFKVT